MFISCKNKNDNDDNDNNQGVVTPPQNDPETPDNEPETPENPEDNENLDSDGVDDEYMPDDGWTDY